jgi:hypothetical protein
MEAESSHTMHGTALFLFSNAFEKDLNTALHVYPMCPALPPGVKEVKRLCASRGCCCGEKERRNGERMTCSTVVYGAPAILFPILLEFFSSVLDEFANSSMAELFTVFTAHLPLPPCIATQSTAHSSLLVWRARLIDVRLETSSIAEQYLVHLCTATQFTAH